MDEGAGAIIFVMADRTLPESYITKHIGIVNIKDDIVGEVTEAYCVCWYTRNSILFGT